jgi:hypothetical protein
MRNIHAQDEDIDCPYIMEVSIFLLLLFLLNKTRTYSYIVNYAYVRTSYHKIQILVWILKIKWTSWVTGWGKKYEFYNCTNYLYMYKKNVCINCFNCHVNDHMK